MGVAGRVLVGTHTCRCHRHHRTYQCERCRAWVYEPPLTEGRCSIDDPNMMAPDGHLRRRRLRPG